jgi:hypothetical protein
MLVGAELSYSWYLFLQLGVAVTFGITAWRAWRHSRARLTELLTACLFGLLLEQGDIFLFGTYRYNENWVLLGDVPIAIALTWAMIIAGAMNITDVLGLPDATSALTVKRNSGTVHWLLAGLPAPMADAVWALLLDLALDAVAIRLGLWGWTIRPDQGWFGVPWGNFFAWLFVAFWFSFLTRLVRARALERGRATVWQWAVPFLAFGGLIATLVPFVALENTSALPLVPDDAPGADFYRNEVWVLFVGILAGFVGVTGWALVRRTRIAREGPDHWLLAVRLVIHGLFLFALLAAGFVFEAPLLLVMALAMLGVELVLTAPWFGSLLGDVRARAQGTLGK